jgi:hypothetical protein
MNDASTPRAGEIDDAVDPAIAKFAEQITRRPEVGAQVFAEDCSAHFPARSEPIRRLFPAIRDLVRLGGRAARGREGISFTDLGLRALET